MNATNDLERQLRSMLEDTALRREPDGLFEVVMSESRSLRQRPASLVALRSGTVEGPARAGSRLVPALLVGLLITSLVGGLLLVGAARILTPPPRAVPGFLPTGSMSTARANAAAVRLVDGRVLVLGGWPSGRDASGLKGVTSAEIYDPDTHEFTPTGSMGEGRVSPSATLLADGRVLVAGGYPFQSMNVGPADPLRSAEVFDPATGTFSPTAPMAEPRAKHLAVRLSSGEVLVIGGDAGLEQDGAGGYQGMVPVSVERFDPTTATFRQESVATRLGRDIEPLVLLPNGSLLVVGVDGLALWDPSAGSIQPVSGSSLHVTTATLLRDGRVLVGGSPLDDDRQGLQLFDPSSGIFGVVASPAGSVEGAAEMGDGRVVVFGRTHVPSNQLDMLVQILTFEVYDPATGAIVSVTPMPGAPNEGRFTATALDDGSILFAGGADAPSGLTTPLDSALRLVPDQASR